MERRRCDRAFHAPLPTSHGDPTMSATTGTNSPPVAGGAKLRHGRLNLLETIGQSIANISPTLTPAVNVPVVVATAGLASWLSFLVGTIGILIVAASVGILAARHTQAG